MYYLRRKERTPQPDGKIRKYEKSNTWKKREAKMIDKKIYYYSDTKHQESHCGKKSIIFGYHW